MSSRKKMYVIPENLLNSYKRRQQLLDDPAISSLIQAEEELKSGQLQRLPPDEKRRKIAQLLYRLREAQKKYVAINDGKPAVSFNSQIPTSKNSTDVISASPPTTKSENNAPRDQNMVASISSGSPPPSSSSNQPGSFVRQESAADWTTAEMQSKINESESESINPI